MQMGAGYWVLCPGTFSTRCVAIATPRVRNVLGRSRAAPCSVCESDARSPVLQLQRPRSECHETQQVCPLRRDRKAKPAEPREMKEVVIAGDQPNLVINAGLRN